MANIMLTDEEIEQAIMAMEYYKHDLVHEHEIDDDLRHDIAVIDSAVNKLRRA